MPRETALLRRAMKYYRLWIYTCNAVLFLCVVVFALIMLFVICDYKMSFLPLPVYHPSLLYAYLALGVQGGLLQAVGCAGAVMLSEKWLNIYWKLMMILLVGDGLEGFVWIFVYNHVANSLPNHMLAQLRDYGVRDAMTRVWDRLQSESRCCGVLSGAVEYNSSFWMTALLHRSSTGLPEFYYAVPKSCCFPHVNENGEDAILGRSNNVTIPPSTVSSSLSEACIVHADHAEYVYSIGCLEVMQTWMQQNANILFILGYCVLTFLKVCFLGILRYEIKEMVQKIKVLHGELPALDVSTLQSPCRLRPRRPGEESVPETPCPHSESFRRNQIEMATTSGGTRASTSSGTSGNNNFNTNRKKSVVPETDTLSRKKSVVGEHESNTSHRKKSVVGEPDSNTSNYRKKSVVGEPDTSNYRKKSVVAEVDTSYRKKSVATEVLDNNTSYRKQSVVNAETDRLISQSCPT